MALSKKAIEILNRQDLVQRRDMWFEKMQNVFTPGAYPHPQDHVFDVNGIIGAGKHDPYTEPEKWVEDCLEDLAERYEAAENDVYFRPLCVELTIFGVHYIDKMLGANVRQCSGQWNTDYLTSPIGQLKAPDLEASEVWSVTKRAVKAFLDAGVALPLFSMPVIASTLNIAVNLYGAEILVEMVDDPENAMKDLTTINDLLCRIHTWFRDNIPARQLQPVVAWNRTQPPGYGQLCGCSTHLISGDLYEELIAPLDNKLLAVYPGGGMIHLCGVHTQHIPAFRKMQHLKALQLNDRAAMDFFEFHSKLREDQVIYFNPCQEVSMEEAIAFSKGKRLVIPEPLDGPILL